MGSRRNAELPFSIFDNFEPAFMNMFKHVCCGLYKPIFLYAIMLEFVKNREPAHAELPLYIQISKPEISRLFFRLP